MISEDQQDQAALYALGMLGVDEAAAFERALAADPELSELTRELRDAAATVALDAEQVAPPAGLRAEILWRVEAGKVVPMSLTWVPWAIAAALAICCGLLGAREGGLRTEIAALRSAANFTAPAAGLEQISFCELNEVPQTQPAPRAAVAWDTRRHEGILRLNNLQPAAEGKDYQLWVVEDGVKDPVSAGVVHVAGDGRGEAVFKAAGNPAVAFALSVERAGGVPKNEGPILLMGKL